MNEFLNPKSMATPGAIGAMVMFISNSICFQFPEVAFRWSTIVLSFLAGTIVFSAKELGLGVRSALWVFNSLIIFSVGVGTSYIGAKIEQAPAPAAAHASAPARDTGPPGLWQAAAPLIHATTATAHPRLLDQSGEATHQGGALAPDGTDVQTLVQQAIEERKKAEIAAEFAARAAARARAERLQLEEQRRREHEHASRRFFKKW
ncbi:MAG: hypothetical protein V4754_04705 [Pseudomonadota bacterium]